MNLTSRDEDILAQLGNSVRCMLPGQIASLWWSPTPTGFKNMAKRIARLVELDLLRFEECLAHPLLPLDDPIFTWRPGDSPPPFASLSWRLQCRWTAQPIRVRAYFCSPRAVTLFGFCGLGQLKNRCQLTHDLHVAEVYLAYRRRWPEYAARWVGEAMLATEAGQKVPDALLKSNAETLRAIEFGGRYPPTRLVAVHTHCARLDLPYEIW